MTDMMKKDNDISRVASGLMAVTVVALVIIGWVAAVVTSDDTGIAKLEPWWRGLSAIFFLMALLWTAHFFLPRRVPLITSVILAAASAMITGFGVAFFRPFGWGDLLWCLHVGLVSDLYDLSRGTLKNRKAIFRDPPCRTRESRKWLFRY